VRVAVIDLGTNTCRLLLAEVERGRVAATHQRLTTVVRLGEGVDARKRLSAVAKTRTRRCLSEYVALIEAYAPQRRLLTATSALRDAADGLEFLSAVEAELAVPWRVVSGDREGRLTFRGAIAAATELRGTVVVVDIGGGSTELCVGQAGVDAGEPTFLRSLDVGAVRLTERFFSHDPPRASEWRAAVDLTRRVLRQQFPLAVRETVCAGIGVAGTITTLVAHELGLREYRREAVDGRMLSLASIRASIARFRPLSSAQRGLLPGIQPGREDVILAGALIAREVCALFGLAGLRCTEADIIEGTALELAAGEDERSAH